METTAERLNYLMKTRGLRQVDILEKAQPFCDKYGVKLTKSNLSQYVNGQVLPGQWKLTILGNALNVSEAWLMGFDVPMERPPESTPEREETPERKELVRLFKKLSLENQKRLLDVAKAFLAAQQLDASQEE